MPDSTAPDIATALIAEARAHLRAMYAPGGYDTNSRAYEQYGTSWPLPRHLTTPGVASIVDRDVACMADLPYASVSYASTALQFGADPVRVAAGLAAAVGVDAGGALSQLPVCGCHGAPQTGFITGLDGTAVGWFHDQAEAEAYAAARGVAA